MEQKFPSLSLCWANYFCRILKVILQKYLFARTSNNSRHNSETQKNPLHSSCDKFCFLFRYHYRPLLPDFRVTSQISAHISHRSSISQNQYQISRVILGGQWVSQDIRNESASNLGCIARIYACATRRAYLFDTALRLRYRYVFNVLLPRILEGL